MKALVTGGAGFIGSWVADCCLIKAFAVCIVDNLSNGVLENINKKAKFYKFDVRDKNLGGYF